MGGKQLARIVSGILRQKRGKFGEITVLLQEDVSAATDSVGDFAGRTCGPCVRVTIGKVTSALVQERHHRQSCCSVFGLYVMAIRPRAGKEC